MRLIFFLISFNLFAQLSDTLVKPKTRKNLIGITFTPGITGSDKYVFASSTYLNYSRTIYRSFFLDLNIGVFNYGSEYKIGGGIRTSFGQSSVVTPIVYGKGYYYSYYFSAQLRPRIILFSSKIVYLQGGIGVNIDYILAYYSDLDGFKLRKTLSVPGYYASIFLGIGFKIRNYRIIVEPEFKQKIGSNSTAFSIGLNLRFAYVF